METPNVFRPAPRRALVLPVGVMHEGTLLREFTLTSPRGSIRGELRDAPDHVPGMDLAAFQHVVASLGPIDSPNQQLLRKLTLPDVTYLHACCTERRYEGRNPVPCVCDACEHRFEDSVTSSDVELKDADAPIEFLNGRAVMRVEVRMPGGGAAQQVCYAVPTLGLEYKYADQRLQKKRRESEIMYERMAECIVSVNDGPGLTAKQLREMDLGDLDALTAAMEDVRVPHLDGEATLTCPECNTTLEEVPIPFEWWVVPFARRKKESGS